MSKFHVKTLCALAAVAALSALAPQVAQAQVYLNVAPPAPRMEVVPRARPGFDWAPGYWSVQGRDHRHPRWVQGRWVQHRSGYEYVPAHWVERRGRWMFVDASWRAEPRRRHGQSEWSNGNRHDRDRDGVPNRYDAQPNNPYRR